LHEKIPETKIRLGLRGVREMGAQSLTGCDSVVPRRKTYSSNNASNSPCLSL
jgi:hypothetical protein